MQVRSSKARLSARAIAGTHTVILGLDVPETALEGLMGFSIHRLDHSTGREVAIQGFKTFPPRKGEAPPTGEPVPSDVQPLQSFHWGDYTVEPDRIYTYKIRSLYGTPGALTVGKELWIKVVTESEDYGQHAIFFNRGVAGSQAYARKFGNKRPDEVPDRAAYKWLSRGLEEAMLRYIGQAKDGTYALRAAVYEFSYAPALEAFAQAAKSGADVKIVYDCRAKGPHVESDKAIEAAGMRELMIPRTQDPNYIAHNKFIVLLKDGKPVEVWTGSTNFTAAGIFGQSNVGHIVRDEKVAQQYLDYWTRLAADPGRNDLRPANVEASPDLGEELEEDALVPIFSPRTSIKALDWYAEQIGKATQTVMFTAAFGVSKVISPKLAEEGDVLRYVMLETTGNTYEQFCRVKNNRIAIGTVLDARTLAKAPKLKEFMVEKLSGLNEHVKYLHTKYLLIDPLGDCPIVVTGSANFSDASTRDNDENMMVIQGDTRVADIFVGEFMRLFTHFYFRDVVAKLNPDGDPDDADVDPYLAADDSWAKRYFEPGSFYCAERKLFA